MKVLMFGWEFPPHISGGLGTACEGMTRALSKAGTDIILVVPKLHGDEQATFRIVSASEVAIPLVSVNRRAKPLVEVVNSGPDSFHESDVDDSMPGRESGIGFKENGISLQSVPYETNLSARSSETLPSRKKRGEGSKDIHSPAPARGEVTTLFIASTLRPYAPSPWPVGATRYGKAEVQESVGIPVTFAEVAERGMMSAERIDGADGGLNVHSNSNDLPHLHVGAHAVAGRQHNSVDIPADDDSLQFVVEGEQEEQEERERQGAEGSMYYPFSGRYDQDLLTEIERFSDVAREVASASEFDVIHAHDWMTFKAGLAARAVSGKMLVLHVHATEIDRTGARPDPRIFALEKEGMMACDRIIAVSNWTKQILVSHYAIAPGKITVVHNGVSHQSALAASRSNPLRVPIVSFVGRITYQKGPMYFIEAAYKVLPKFPEVHFVIAGSGDQLTQVIDQVAHLRIGDNFSFTGFLKGSDVDRLWSMTDLYVMPSVSEPFGITPLEAVRAGVPVILSKQSGVSEVLPHAMKVNFWDTDALASAICSVLSYPILARVMSANATTELASITWERAADRIADVYAGLLRA